uniref:Uncharacterized protein n=2 Tax=Ovis aries TaxID=9940 RepID=A0AC11EDR6_SHEEP
MLERNVGRPDHKACGHQNEYEGSLHLAEGRNAMRKPATGSSRGLLKISQQHILPLLHKDREDAQLWLPLEIKDTPPGMDVSRLFLATLLVCLCFLSAYSHLAPEEKPRDERNLKNNSSMNLLDFPSVSIVALNKKSKKISRNEAEKKKRASKGIFPTQESNPVLLHRRQTLYRLTQDTRSCLQNHGGRKQPLRNCWASQAALW